MTTYHKRREQRQEQRDRSFGRGFATGFVFACTLLAAFLYGESKVNAAHPEPRYGKSHWQPGGNLPRPLVVVAKNPMVPHADIAGMMTNGDVIKIRIGSGKASSWAVYRIGERTMPPGWRTFLRICQLEQPGDGWRGVWWTNLKVNYSFPGGCGLTRQNYTEVKHPAWPDTADQLSPRDQLWASFWLFWKHARIGQTMRDSYDGGQRYGSTVWDVHNQPGLMFDGFKNDGKTPA